MSENRGFVVVVEDEPGIADATPRRCRAISVRPSKTTTSDARRETRTGRPMNRAGTE